MRGSRDARPADDLSHTQPVIMLGGALRPAEDTFRPLRRVLAGQVRLLEKDLEAVQREPGEDYTLDIEVDALMKLADEYGWERFQLVAVDEGASVAIVAALRHPERVISLGLDEPVWAGNREPSEEEWAYWQRVTNAIRLEDSPLVEQYAAIQVGKQALPNDEEADLQPPPDTHAPDVPVAFRDARPNALRALWRAFSQTDLDYRALARLHVECYIAVGGDSDPACEALAKRLHGLMPHAHYEIYVGRSRLESPHEIEEERFALALSQLWRAAQREAIEVGAPTAEHEPSRPHFA